MFGKKQTAEELLKLFSALSEEEKQKFLEVVKGDGEEKLTEEPASDGAPDADVTAEAENENENGKEAPTPPAEETEGEDETSLATTEEAAATEEKPAEDAPTVPDSQAVENTAEILEGYGARLTAIEETLKELAELKELMQKFTQAQAEKFGYSGTVPGGKKDFQEMSADEMKNKILNGEI